MLFSIHLTEVLKQKLPVGTWNIFQWNGIKVELDNLEKLHVKEISNIIKNISDIARIVFKY
jgi:hypothetical protein